MKQNLRQSPPHLLFKDEEYDTSNRAHNAAKRAIKEEFTERKRQVIEASRDALNVVRAALDKEYKERRKQAELEHYAVWLVSEYIRSSDFKEINRGEMDEVIDFAMEGLEGETFHMCWSFSATELVEFLKTNSDNFSTCNDLAMVAV